MNLIGPKYRKYITSFLHDSEGVHYEGNIKEEIKRGFFLGGGGGFGCEVHVLRSRVNKSLLFFVSQTTMVGYSFS